MRIIIIVVFVAASAAVSARVPPNHPSLEPVVPRAWTDRADAELPLADAAATPTPISADYYYRIPVRPMLRTYPVYAPGREPAGYREWLERQEPADAFNPAALRTEADWVAAGETVFDAPISANDILSVEDARDPRWYARVSPPVAADGSVPALRYVVRERGKVELGTVSCAMCHTRVLADGTVVKGAQGNFPFDRAASLAAGARFPLERLRGLERSLFGAPWLEPDPQAGLERARLETMASWHAAIPPGVVARQGSSPLAPLQVPDLIGVKDRAYLDHTGLSRHRSVADLMRYSALNQGAADLSSYGGFIPAARDFRTRPLPETRGRYSDEQLYALSLYLYSLRPPSNPNRMDETARRGERIFAREGCAQCHTPPRFTNDRLTLADGYTLPTDHPARPDVMPLSVGTDATTAMRTRRGTGLYKVPSLRGVWYRGPFEHNGSVATLEDWFDPRRLRDDYVPTGFRGAGVEHRAVRGHEYGLALSPSDRRALIAYLRTL